MTCMLLVTLHPNLVSRQPTFLLHYAVSLQYIIIFTTASWQFSNASPNSMQSGHSHCPFRSVMPYFAKRFSIKSSYSNVPKIGLTQLPASAVSLLMPTPRSSLILHTTTQTTYQLHVFPWLAWGQLNWPGRQWVNHLEHLDHHSSTGSLVKFRNDHYQPSNVLHGNNKLSSFFEPKDCTGTASTSTLASPHRTVPSNTLISSQ